jgi:hypothetical protein
MKFQDAALSLLIILLFVGLYAYSIISIGKKDLAKNWPKYRCNPMMMPFASQFGPPGTDTTKNFTSCVQSQTKSLMGDLLKPVHYATSLANSSTGGISSALNDVRKVFDYVKNMVKKIVEQIIGVFMNILIEFLKIIISLKDLGSKIMGVMTLTIFMIDGMYKSGESIWAGPVGDVVRFLCFHPKTPIVLKNGKRKNISEIKIGDILVNDSKVLGTLKLQGSGENPYYRIYSEVLNTNIFVTGSHLIQNPHTGKFIPVSQLPESIKGKYYTESMNCLITDDHLIPVGEHIFWDWEDDN